MSKAAWSILVIIAVIFAAIQMATGTCMQSSACMDLPARVREAMRFAQILGLNQTCGGNQHPPPQHKPEPNPCCCIYMPPQHEYKQTQYPNCYPCYFPQPNCPPPQQQPCQPSCFMPPGYFSQCPGQFRMEHPMPKCGGPMQCLPPPFPCFPSPGFGCRPRRFFCGRGPCF